MRMCFNFGHIRYHIKSVSMITSALLLLYGNTLMKIKLFICPKAHDMHMAIFFVKTNVCRKFHCHSSKSHNCSDKLCQTILIHALSDFDALDFELWKIFIIKSTPFRMYSFSIVYNTNYSHSSKRSIRNSDAKPFFVLENLKPIKLEIFQFISDSIRYRAKSSNSQFPLSSIQLKRLFD